MAIYTLLLRTSLRALRPEIGFPLSRCKAEPQAAQYVGIFEPLLVEWGIINDKEQALYDAAVECKAQVYAWDRTLNVLASRVSKAALLIAGDDKTRSVYENYFGKKTLKEFIRPILNLQLVAMEGWISPLTNSEHPTLKALAPEVEAAVKGAKAAAENRLNAERAVREFRKTGDRRKFIDKVNAMRKLVYGELSKLAHEDESLPPDFADSFFLHDTYDGETETVATVEAKIEALIEEMEEQKQRLAQLKAEEQARAKAEAEMNAYRAELAEQERIEEEAAKKAAKLRAKLKKKSPHASK